jgi:phosphatidylserine/phosphatidylglycerophosphate/cardiolipin synthase-like enzyme
VASPDTLVPESEELPVLGDASAAEASEATLPVEPAAEAVDSPEAELVVAPAPEPPLPAPPPPLPRPPAPPVMPGLDPPRWRPILTAVLSPQATMRDGNSVRFLIDGPGTFRSMVEAIRSAQNREHYIYLLGWVLVDDFQLIPGDPTTTFRQLTAEAAGRGVQIRAMLWAKPPLDNRNEVARMNALPTGAAIRDDETPHPKPPVFGAHHQKLLVVKGSLGLIGYCGGLDINSDRIMVVHRGKGEPLHDVHCRIQGPAAWDALQTFVRRWLHHPDHRGVDRRRGPLLGYTEPVPRPITTPAPGTSSIPGTCSVAVARTFTPVTRGSTLVRERDIKHLLLQAIGKAQRFIYMEEQYLISLQAAVALRAAIPRLQHLTILITASEFIAPGRIPDLPCAWKFRRDFIAALTSGLSPADRDKVRIFHRITPSATQPTFGPHAYVHAKTWVFDDELAVIGSANCNRRGWEHDSEVDAFIFDEAPLVPGALSFAQAMRMALWSEHLAVPPSAVLDGVASAGIWRTPPLGAAVRPYNPTGGRDARSDQACDLLRGAVDPGLESAEHIAQVGGADANQAIRVETS